MKHVVVQSISSIVLYILTALSFGSLTTGIYQTVNHYHRDEAFIFQMNALPWIALILFGISWSIYSYKTRPNKNLSFWKWSVQMTEFSEVDEREQIITAKATKAAYVSFSISVPILMGSFMFYPLFEDALPTYPIYALASTLIIATFVYMVTWIRAYTR
ncbi:hypothetical protein [Exiguobacterium qingdaonense]|uniref:hypothetical protein n=1 Tax=Exiguobacterium qingdaonense TaxID=2751251 RepID=UPI001BE9EBB8|nr:hypothetical protein [Exiguobacterium qingdaonense]